MSAVTVSTENEAVALAFADASGLVDPSAGALRALQFAGVDILRPAAAHAAHPFELASFVLSPFANRIAHGAFRFDGRAIRLTPAREAHPHALHGLGWRAPWTVLRATPAAIELCAQFAAGEWPWAHEVMQTIALDADGFTHRLAVVNRAETPMPLSIGFHPYFARAAGMRIVTAAEAIWETDAGILPVRMAPPPARLATGIAVDDLPDLDHCLSGWSRQARLSVPGRVFDIVVEASETLGFLHVYKPPDADYFCLEPVSAMPDSFNRPEAPSVSGLRVLAPGETLRASMTIRRAAPV